MSKKSASDSTGAGYARHSMLESTASGDIPGPTKDHSTYATPQVNLQRLADAECAAAEKMFPAIGVQPVCHATGKRVPPANCC